MSFLNFPLWCLRRVRTLALLAGLGCYFATGVSARAATISTGDVTASLGPTFFVDDAVNGGTDTDINQPSVAAFDRIFSGLLTRNQGPARVTLTGFGFAAHTSATANDASTIAVTFTYLGADELPGGGDDVVIGTATGTYNFTAGGEYVFAFDTPLAADLTITGTRFRIQIAPTNAGGNGSLKLKTDVLTYESTPGPKFSVAGIVAAQRLNLAKYQTVLTDSVSGQRLAGYVTDGVAGNDNRWESSGSGPHWAQVVFPFPVTVGSAQVFTGLDDGSASTSFKLQYLSNSTWVDVPGASVTGNTNVERNLVFTSPVKASSLRIYDSADATLRVKEFALYPPNGATGHPIGTDVTLDLAYQRPALATANTAGNFALLAVDGRVNKASMWQTSTAGANSLEIDLRVSTKIGSAHLYSGSPGVSPLAAFVLRYWDGAAWQDVPGGTVAGNTTSALVIPFTSAVTTSKVRLEFTNPGTTSLQELCIFPANAGNSGYPLGTGVIGAPPSTAKYDDTNDTFYNLTNPTANLFMAVSNGAPGLNQPGLTSAQGQYQVLLNLGNGTYRMRNRATGFCLSGAQLSSTPGTPLVDAPYAALPDQDWILEPIGSTGFYYLINSWSGLVIDTQGGGTAAGTALVQSVHAGAASQRWQLVNSTTFPKKGVGGTSFASTFNVNWAYSWGLSSTQTLPAGAVFNPMQWGDYYWDVGTNSNASTWKLYSTWRGTAGPLHVLGFNEPDTFSQSGQSLDPNHPATAAAFSSTRSMTAAVMLWPRLLAMDEPLVAPCPANMTGGWLAAFFTQAANLGYRVDYTAKHSYGSPNGGSSNSLISDLQTGYTTWGRPMWLTEFSFVDWSGSSSWSDEDNYNCLAEFLWRAESVTWLRKYALFVFTEDASSPNPALPWSAVTPGPRSNSYDINGKLTPFGELYAAWDNDATVRSDKTYYIHNKITRKRLANTLAATPDATSIRTDDTSVRWALVASPTSNQYYIVSARDGRRLSFNGTSVSQVTAGTTGTAVQWSLTENQYGWFYLGHPATTKRLKLAYNNSTSAATFSMVANTIVSDDVLWRFIVPSPPLIWSGASNTSWTAAGNWIPGVVPSAGDVVNFDSTSTANLNTMLNQDFNLLGVNVTSPAGPVAIGGINSLTIGANGLDLAGASQDLTISAPVVLGATQNWSVASGRTLSIKGRLSGSSSLTITGAGAVSLGGVDSQTGGTTINLGATILTRSANVLPNGAGAGSLVVNGTLDLNGTSQSINSLSGSGSVDTTGGGAAALTVGTSDVTGTLSCSLQNTSGTLALLKTGSGTLTLSRANTHGGGFTNNGTGSVIPKNNDAFGTGPVVMNSGTLYPIAASYTFANALTLNGASLHVGGGASHTVTWSGPVSVTADSELNADGSTAGITLSGGVDMNDGGHTLSSFANGTAHTLAAPISGGSGTIMVTYGTLNLNAANPFSGSFRSSLGGPLKLGDALAMQNATLDMNAADSGTVSLNNLNAILGALTGSRSLALGSGTVAIGNNHLSTTYSGVLNGTGSLVKTGNGTLTLAGSNIYTGATSVDAGTLALGASNVLPATAVSIGNATLDAAAFTDTLGTLNITSTAKIHLGNGAAIAFADSSALSWGGGLLTLSGTFVSGSSLRFGTTSSGLTSSQLALITAAGFSGFALNASGFLTATLPGSYAAWQVANNTAQPMNLDHDNDGVSNGIEYFLGGTTRTTGFTALPGVTHTGASLSITWTKAASYTGAYPTDFVVETTSTLIGPWTPAALGTGADKVAITGTSVKYTFPAGTQKFARLKVIGP